MILTSEDKSYPKYRIHAGGTVDTTQEYGCVTFEEGTKAIIVREGQTGTGITILPHFETGRFAGFGKGVAIPKSEIRTLINLLEEVDRRVNGKEKAAAA